MAGTTKQAHPTRIERVKETLDRLQAGIEELFDSERFKDYLATMARFHRYSLNNTILIALQRPDATRVAGFNTWKNEFKRTVKKGEQGIRIFAPAPYKIVVTQTSDDEEEEREVLVPAYKVVSVFDISQMEGEPLPQIVTQLDSTVSQYGQLFTALLEVSPVPVVYEMISGSCLGYFDPQNKRIALKSGMSEAQTIKTAFHEIAHAKLHNIDEAKQRTDLTRNTEEVEAEAVAFAVAAHFGLDTSEYSFGYIAGWSAGREMTELKGSLERIRATADEIITEVEKRLTV